MRSSFLFHSIVLIGLGSDLCGQETEALLQGHALLAVLVVRAEPGWVGGFGGLPRR